MADPSLFVGKVVELPTRSSDKNLAVVSRFDNDTLKFTLMFASSGKHEETGYEEFLKKKIKVLNDEEGERRLAQRGMKKIKAYGVYGTRKLNSVNGRLVVINDPALIERFGGKPSNKTMVVKTVPASDGRIQVMTPSGAKKAMKAADFATGKLLLYDPKNRSDLLAQFTKQMEETTQRMAAKKTMTTQRMDAKKRMNKIKGVTKKKTLTKIKGVTKKKTVAQAAVRVRPRQKEQHKRLSDAIQKKQNEIQQVLTNALTGLGPLQSTMINRTQNRRQVVNQNVHVRTLEKELESLEKRKERLITRKRLSKNVLQNYIAQKVKEKNVKELKRVYATDFEYYAMQGAGTGRRGFGREFDRAEALKTAIEDEREKVQKWTNANVRDAITSQLDRRAMEVDADMKRAGQKLQELTNKEARRRTRRGLPTVRAKLKELKLQLLTAPPTLQAAIQKEIQNFEALQKETQRTLKPLPPDRVFKNKQSKQNNQTDVDTGEFSDELVDKMKRHFAQQAKRRGMQTNKLLNVAEGAREGLKTTLITQHAQKALPGVTKADQRLRVRLMNVASKNPSYFVIRKGGLYLSQKAQKMIRELRKRVLQGNAGYVASPVRELAKVRKMSNVGSFGYDLKYPIELEYRTTAADATRKHRKNKTTSKDSFNLLDDRADGTTLEGAVKLLKILGKMGVHTGKPVGKILKGQPLSDAVAFLEALNQDGPTMYSSRPRKVVRPVGMETAAKRGYTEEFYTTKSQDKIRSNIVTAFIKALTYQSCGCELSDPGARLVRSRACDERLPLNYHEIGGEQMTKFRQEENTLLKRSYPMIASDIPQPGKENQFTKMFYKLTDSDPSSLGQLYETNRAYIKNVIMPSLATGLRQLMKKYALRETDLDPKQNNRPTGSYGLQGATGGVNRATENRAALARGNIANRANSTSTAVNLVLGSCDRGLDFLLSDDMFTLRNQLTRGTGSYKMLRHVHEQYGPILDFKIKNGNQQKSYLENVGISIAFLFFNGVNGQQTVRDALYALYRMHIFSKYVYAREARWCQSPKRGSLNGYAIPLAKSGNQARTPRQILEMIMEGKLEEADKFKYKVKDTPTMDSDRSDSALIRIFSFLQLAASEVITESEIMQFLFIDKEFKIFSQGDSSAEENPLKYHSNLVNWIRNTSYSVILSIVAGRVCLPVLLADPELSALLSRTAAQYHLVTNGLELVAEYKVAHKKSEIFDRLRAEMRTLASLKKDRNKAQQIIKDTTENRKKTTNRRQINMFEKQLKDTRETLRKLNGRINRAAQELNDKSKYKDYFIRLSDDFTNVLRDAESRGAITMNEKQNSSKKAIELLFQHVKSRKNSNLQDVKLSFVDSSNRDKHTSTKELVFYAAAPKPTTQMTPDEAQAWFKKALKVQGVLPATARGCDTKSGSRNVKRTTGFATPQLCLRRKLSVLHNMEIPKPISLGAMRTQQFTTEEMKNFNTKMTMPWLIPREHRFNATQVSENQKRAWMNYLFALHAWLPENTPGKLKFNKNKESWERYGRRVLERRGAELNALDKKLRPDPTEPPRFTDEMKQTAKELFPKLRRTGIVNRFKD